MNRQYKPLLFCLRGHFLFSDEDPRGIDRPSQSSAELDGKITVPHAKEMLMKKSPGSSD
jgi:hypothetical protein